MGVLSFDSDELARYRVAEPDPIDTTAATLLERMAELTAKLESVQQQLTRIETLVAPHKRNLPDGY